MDGAGGITRCLCNKIVDSRALFSWFVSGVYCEAVHRESRHIRLRYDHARAGHRRHPALFLSADAAREAAQRQLRPDLAAVNADPHFAQLARQCTDPDPALRPTAAELVDRLSQLTRVYAADVAEALVRAPLPLAQ